MGGGGLAQWNSPQKTEKGARRGKKTARRERTAEPLPLPCDGEESETMKEVITRVADLRRVSNDCALLSPGSVEISGP